MWKQTRINPKYEVSDDGRVRTISSGHIKAQKIDRYGYAVVCLSETRTKKKYATVHRLVAEAFIPNPDGLPQVNHKDENKLNNNVDNLEWCTAHYNSHYGNGRAKCDASRCKPIVATSDDETLEFSSTKEAAEKLGVNKSSIRGALKGRQHTSCGYTWKYKSEEVLPLSPEQKHQVRQK